MRSKTRYVPEVRELRRTLPLRERRRFAEGKQHRLERTQLRREMMHRMDWYREARWTALLASLEPGVVVSLPEP